MVRPFQVSLRIINGNLVLPNSPAGIAYAIAESVPGYAVRKDLGRIRSGLRLFKGNYDELKAFVCFGFVASPNSDAMADETIRLVHNLLAAAGTLKYVTMRGVSHAPEGIAAARDYRLACVGDVVPFVQSLRNLVLHGELPRITVTLETLGMANENRSTLCFSTSALRKLQKWPQRPRLYLDEHPHIVPLNEMADDYVNAIETLTTGVVDDISVARAEQLAAYEQLVAEAATLVSPSFGQDWVESLIQLRDEHIEAEGTRTEG
jgi:hypothetical protein